jgi:bis(5'-adenosyl)-triphosphatase
MDCPFCPPIVEKATFASSLNFHAVYNIAPILPGHTLIIPKKHISSFMELEDNLIQEMMLFSKKIICFIQQEFAANGFDFTIQDGESAGQTVHHLHAHVVPRYPRDLPEPGDWYPKLKQKQGELLDSFSREKITDMQMLEIINYLKKKAASIKIKESPF